MLDLDEQMELSSALGRRAKNDKLSQSRIEYYLGNTSVLDILFVKIALPLLTGFCAMVNASIYSRIGV